MPDATAYPMGDEEAGQAPLAGVRIIEIGRFAAGPACATVLADWGADVIKVEPPGGDPARGPGSLERDGAPPVNPRFEVHNRSRRSVVLDLRIDRGRAALDRLLATADVFVTNLSPGALERLELDAATLRERHPRLIVAQISGYDLASPLAGRRSYDHGAYWSYSGAASLFAGPDGEPPQPAGGFGDRAAGSALAGAVAAALFARQRTGTGGHVTTSLAATGMWLMASDAGDLLNGGRAHRAGGRDTAPIPTVNCFRTADARWLWLQVMTPDRDWDRLLDALGAPWLDEDPRFRGGDPARLRANRTALLELLDELFRERPLAEWADRLGARRLVWAPVRGLEEAVADPEVRAGSAVVEFDDEFGVRHVSVNTPCLFDGATPRPPTRAPEAGEDTRAVLAAAGIGEAELAELTEAGAIDAGALDSGSTGPRGAL
ncbi:CaiB/BaiF CoA transferase family protein [Actinomadura rugatobispora]|uniref:CaiB/BaiF CoA transferase family protein n=1 Tax=Actinomadura rugatobispora TaxID=1994 RepID=A0ABW1AFD3_9ACTN|nr:CaiB/BaiF CoA-transferase family protein [Actinomadura rugatobispora]